MKKLFPTLKVNRGNIYLDNAATSLKLKNVIDSVSKFYRFFSLNNHSFSENTFHNEIKKAVDETRTLISKWINCKACEVVFMPSTTYSLNILALSIFELIKKGDSILITKLEHSSNVYPWMEICKKRGAELNYLPLNNKFKIDEKEVAKMISNDTKVVSFSHVSNSVGSLNNILEITKIIKKKSPECFIIVDACQSIANETINVNEWLIDALVFSAHKVYGPTGIGVLWIKEESEKRLPHILWGGGKITSPFDLDQNKLSPSYSKFEVGSLPLSQIFGLREVFFFLNSINWKKKKKKEKILLEYATKMLSEVKGIVIYNKYLSSNIILFNISNFHSHDISNYLIKKNIFVRGGNFCSPFLKELIGTGSAIRVSLAIYNNKRDIDKLVENIKEIKLSKLIY